MLAILQNYYMIEVRFQQANIVQGELLLVF